MPAPTSTSRAAALAADRGTAPSRPRGPSTRARRRTARRRCSFGDRGRDELVGRDRCVAPSCSPSSRRHGCGSLRTMSVTPALARARRSLSVADRSAAGDEHPLARLHAARVMPCSATASGSVERGVAQRQAVGQAEQPRPRRTLMYVGERALEVAALADRARPEHRLGRPARQYSHSPQRTRRAADRRRRRPPSRSRRRRPRRRCPSTRGRRPSSARPQPSSTKWMSEPQTPQWLTSSSTSSGAELRDRVLLDLDPPIALVDRGPHRRGDRFRHARERCPNLTRTSTSGTRQ